MKKDNQNKLEVLMQSKNLVHASYTAKTIENRVFYYCLYNAQKPNEHCESLTCEVKTEDFKKVITNRNQQTITNIKKILDILRDTEIYFETVEGGDDVENHYTLIAGFSYNRTKDIFKITFIDKVYNYVRGKGLCSPLNLDIACNFQSFQTQKFYELMRLWSETNQTTVTQHFKIEQLKFILGINKNKYPVYKNFKQMVINKAIKEIKEKANMKVEIHNEHKIRVIDPETNKVKKVVDSVQFKITDLEEKDYFKNQNKNIVDVEDFSIVDDDNKNNIKDDNNNNNNNSSNEENEKTPTKKKTTKKSSKTKKIEASIPYEEFFSKTALPKVKKDLVDYDLEDESIKEILKIAIDISLKKDNVKQIFPRTYPYFLTVFEDRVENKKENNSKEVNELPKNTNEIKQFVPTKPTKAHEINQTFTKYGEKELEELLFKSQEGKFPL